MSLDPGQSRERQRLLLRRAVALHGIQGTPRGIELAVEAVFGLRAEVQETGRRHLVDGRRRAAARRAAAGVRRCGCSPRRVRRWTSSGSTSSWPSLKPAHVVHRVEVVPG